AGLREASGRVERLGVERAREVLTAADLAVLVLPEGTSASEVDAWCAEAGGVPLLHARSKADLMPSPLQAPSPLPVPSPLPLGEGKGEGVVHPSATLSAVESLRVSGVTGEGVDALRARMRERLLGEDVTGAVLVTSERHAEALRRCAEALLRADDALRVSTLEAVAGEVGLAHEALAEITGENASQALLDALFARFCIGK
ncbi:MAG: tRNA uridine-5-carboxymethylaminomethyl(34) synthesis GTPase MnmE, partial [Myxococcaceae bacterium]|nr:tRNA uridine-5-carboxymethylaminomethyl(34) synthesis GTPase MnmE [Myxococcaceae bacterium]